MKSGCMAPAFSLRDENGKLHRLSQYKGQKIVLYFYPKDGTPGCTIEAKNFNKDFKQIQAKGVILLGVSPDNEVSHKRFSEELKLNFPLLADPDAEIASKYGAYGEKEIFGSKFESVFRTTFIINEKGRVEKVFEDVKVKDHTKEVLKAL
ncbi:MAG: thioredoxin-dependent thiol peroxidase [bacterium]|nr:thioredoxin-dependent thiol peroxidase [bacterium]